MKGTEKIIARIENEAKAQADEIIAKAEAEAAAILEEGNKAAQEKYWDKIRAGTKEGEALVEHRTRNAEMEAKKSILATKQEQISKVFDRAKELLVKIPQEDYVKLLAGMAKDASSSGQELLIFNECDKAAVGKAVAKAANELLAAEGKDNKLTVAEETREIMGGFVLKQGGIEVNCSIETLVDMQRDRTAASVAAVLFE